MNRADVAKEAVQAAPPVSVALATLAGMNLNDWVLVCTLTYLILQMGFLIFKWYRAIVGKPVE